MKRQKHHRRGLSEETRSRIRLATKLFTTYGSGLLTGTVVQIYLVGHGGLNLSQIAGLAAGLVFHGLALYIQPKGDSDVHSRA